MEKVLIVLVILMFIFGCSTAEYVTVCHQEGAKEVCSVVPSNSLHRNDPRAEENRR